MGQQRVEEAVSRRVGVHRQLLPKGLLLPPVREPIIHPYLRDQIGAQAVSFRRGHASLQAFGSTGKQDRDIVSATQK